MKLRIALISDCTSLQKIFVETIFHVCKFDYSPKQLAIWASGIENEERWKQILNEQLVIVAEENQKILGFCTLSKNCYIDLLFIHKNVQRQGIAQKLYKFMEKIAIENSQSIISADVSITALPFFRKMGFDHQVKQTVILKGTEFINYKMSKKIV